MEAYKALKDEKINKRVMAMMQGSFQAIEALSGKKECKLSKKEGQKYVLLLEARR